MANIKARTKKLEDYIRENCKENELVTLSTEVLENATGESLSENAKVALRKTIPFSIGNVIPEIQEGKRKNMVRSLRPMGLRLVSKETYATYKFTNKNFRALEDNEIQSIIEKLNTVCKTKEQEFIFKMLTLCDVIVLKNGRNVYKPLKLRLLSSYILEPVDATKERLNLLVKAKVLREIDEAYCFVTEEYSESVANTEHIFGSRKTNNTGTKVLKNIDTKDLNGIIVDVNEMDKSSIQQIKQNEKTSVQTNGVMALNNAVAAILKEHNEIIQKNRQLEQSMSALRKQLDEAKKAEILYQGTRRQFLAIKDENEKLKQKNTNSANIDEAKEKIKSSLNRIEAHIGNKTLAAAEKFLMDNNSWEFKNAVADAVKDGFSSLKKII